MPQRAKGTHVTLDELDKIEGKTPETPGGKEVQPGFFSRLGETVVSPIMAFGQGIESMGRPGASGVDAAIAAAQSYAQHQDPTRAVLAGTPVGSPSEDIYNRNWAGLAGTAAGTALLATPEFRNISADVVAGGAKSFGRKVPIPVPKTGKTVNVPEPVAGGVTGYVGGAGLGYPVHHPGAGAIIGGVSGAAYPIIRGAVEEVKSGWRARHPWEGPDIAPGETRTPYRASRAVREGYRNPPATGSQVSGPIYQVPKEEPSPLDKITGETKSPAWRPRREDPGYRNPPSRVKPPEPALVPSTAMKHLLNAFQEMIKRQQPKD